MAEIVEIAYFTDQLPAMIAFYRALLGAEPVVRGEGMAIFLVGNTKLFLHRTYTAGPKDLPPEHHVAIGAADVDATCAALLAAGLTLEVPPEDYYWGRSAYLRDPDGHLVELSAPT